MFEVDATRRYRIGFPGTEREFIDHMYQYALHEYGPDTDVTTEFTLASAVIVATTAYDAGDLTDIISLEDEDYEVLPPPTPRIEPIQPMTIKGYND